MSKRVFLSITLLMLVSVAVYAQTGVAQVQGVATDASGAVIPNAAVTLANTQTGIKFETTTNEAGLFLFPSLQTGEYKLTVSAPGLQKWEGQATLRAGQQAVINAALQVAQATEQVTVVGNVTQLVTTNSPTIATTVERARIERPFDPELVDGDGARFGRGRCPASGLWSARFRHGV